MIHILLDADLYLYSRQDFLGTLNPLIRDKATRVCKKMCHSAAGSGLCLNHLKIAFHINGVGVQGFLCEFNQSI